jgi:hypothetical protein
MENLQWKITMEHNNGTLKDGTLPQQTIVLNSGKQINRTVINVDGPIWGYQTGTCGYLQEWREVYRDNQVDVRWFEADKLPDIDEPDVSHRQAQNREIHAVPVAQGRRF